MKKLLQKIIDFKALGALLFVLLLFSNVGWGQQQLIGSFPTMDGGFENQTTGSLITSGGGTVAFKQLRGQLRVLLVLFLQLAEGQEVSI